MKTPHYTAGVVGREWKADGLLDAKGLSEARGHIWTSYILLFRGIYLI